MSDGLAPPRKSIELEDPGAKELIESSSDEHFSDASEGRALHNARNEATSPIPITRVERVDDEPSHGEVPGTEAYRQRTLDAVPDEVEIVPDGMRSRSASRVSINDRPITPGGTPIPKTVVEKIDPDQPAYGDVPGTEAHQLRLADAEPDIIIRAPQPPQRNDQGSPTASIDRSPINDGDNEDNDDDDDDEETDKNNKIKNTNVDDTAAVDDENEEKPPKSEDVVSYSTTHDEHNGDEEEHSRPEHITTESTADNLVSTDEPAAPVDDSATKSQEHLDDFADDAEVEDDDGFGDFDEFEEGGEGDDDFGDFDDGFQQGEDEAETTFDNPPDQAPVPAPPTGPPVLDFASLTSAEEVISATQPYINELYPSLQDIPSISASEDTRSIFLSERSQSLWTQLVAPPPLQPPDWVRSRIRRLFLVSLGVPVDLDEILPASKQKKLILPSINIPGEKSPRPSSDNRPSALDRVKRDNASSTSVESSNSKPDRKRKGPPPPPELDISATSMLCSTTDAALQNFTDEELAVHVNHLEGLQVRAKEVFEYWQKRMESALGDKDAFEQVIESLVAHAKKLR